MNSLRIFSLTLLLVSLPLPAAALPTLDQAFGDPNHPHGDGLQAPTSSEWGRAQSFTVGVSGSLVRLGLWVRACCSDQDPNPLPYPLDPLEIQLVRTSGGAPSLSPTDVLDAEFVSQAAIDALRPAGGGYSWVELELSVPPHVSAGDVLAIVLPRYPEPGFPVDANNKPYWWQGADWDGPPNYAGGEVWSRLNDGPWIQGDYSNEDMFFATWVDSSAVPEPGSGWIATLSLLALVSRRAVFSE